MAESYPVPAPHARLDPPRCRALHPGTLPPTSLPSRREQIQMTDDELRAFLDEQMVMQCATVGPHGLPHLVPLWFVRRRRAS